KKRISLRVEKMVEEGWLEEVNKLKERKIPLNSQCFKSIGYREIFEVLEGKLNLSQAKEIIVKKTVDYSKRQMTWFKRERDVFWIKGQDLELAFFSALRYIKEKTEGDIYDK
ncbi:MAG: tRNA dimethylallyltransferase, partial [Thermoanaerobaculia bacterium]